MTFLRSLFTAPARLWDRVLPPSTPILPTRWDRHVPRALAIPWLLLKTYLVIAGGFGLLMYYLHRMGLPSLWPH